MPPIPLIMKKILIANPAGYGLEAPEVGHFLVRAAKVLWQRGITIDISCPMKSRIHQMRNVAVKAARQQHADAILFIDPDIVPDALVHCGMTPFLPAALQFFDEHPGSVLAAPYCGAYPKRSVQVFACDEHGKLIRMSHKSTKLRGWLQVAAVGTGLMLIDMAVFDSLSPPYFFDRFRDVEETTLEHTQDVVFSKRVREAGHKIWCNFSAWCVHWQNNPVEPPGFEGKYGDTATTCPN